MTRKQVQQENVNQQESPRETIQHIRVTIHSNGYMTPRTSEMRHTTRRDMEEDSENQATKRELRESRGTG